MENRLIELIIDQHNITYHIVMDQKYLSDKFITDYIKIKDGWVVNHPKRHEIRVDKANGKNGQEHIHIFEKGQEFWAINKDGSPRHGTWRKPIPKKLKRWLKKEFPDFNIPYKIMGLGGIVFPEYPIKNERIFSIDLSDPQW